MNPSSHQRVARLHKLAQEMRAAVLKYKDQPYTDTLCGRHLRDAMKLGAFTDVRWLTLRQGFESNHGAGPDFFIAMQWAVDHAEELELTQSDQLTNGNTVYWGNFFADQIDTEADQIAEMLANQPVDYWDRINHTWKHSRIGTGAVLLAIVVPVVQGWVATVWFALKWTNLMN